MFSKYPTDNIKFGPIPKKKNKIGLKFVNLNSKKTKRAFDFCLPFMKAPFGASTFKNEKTKNGTMSLSMNVDDDDVEKYLLSIEDTVLAFAEKNSEVLFKKKWTGDFMREAGIFKSLLKVDPGGVYLPKVTVKVGPKTKVLLALSETELDPDKPKGSLKDIVPYCHVRAHVKVEWMYVGNNKFGLTLSAKTVAVLPPDNQKDEEEEDDSDEEDVTNEFGMVLRGGGGGSSTKKNKRKNDCDGSTVKRRKKDIDSKVVEKNDFHNDTEDVGERNKKTSSISEFV